MQGWLTLHFVLAGGVKSKKEYWTGLIKKGKNQTQSIGSLPLSLDSASTRK